MNENNDMQYTVPKTESSDGAWVYPGPAAYSAAATAVPEKKKKGWNGKRALALALCCAVLGGAVGVGGYMLADRHSGTAVAEGKGTTIYESNRPLEAVNVAYVGSGEPMTAATVYEANVNSTVGITTSISVNYWGYQTTTAASGSGFVLTEDGYILTCYHVVEDSESITVSTYDGETYEAELIGYDDSNDIAVLKVEAKDLTPVVLGDSEGLSVGDDVIAIGNPLGELTFTLTKGVVSALGREVTLSTGSTMALIQTDCAINSGNSGGALFNMYGEVIGITNAKYSSSSYSGEASIDNIGFAIPINTVKNIVSSIIEKGYVAKPYIGVSVTNVGEEAVSYGLPEGAAVKAVTEDSPAEEAGLQENDIITRANNKEITSSSDLVELVSAMASGDKLELEVYRQGETLKLTLTVGEKITSALENEESSEKEEQGQTDTEQQEGTWQYRSDSDDFNSLPWSFFFGN